MIIIGETLSLAQLEAVALHGEEVSLAPAAVERVQRNRDFVQGLVSKGETVYGVTTGFGRFANKRIDESQVRQLQRNLILSHSVGVGEPFPTEVVRAMLLLRAQSLSHGASGVRPVVLEQLAALLNAKIHPVIPSQGSVGASGDLAPLAHMALAMIGEGEVEVGGEVKPAGEALAAAGIEKLVLEAKEGLALINGTQAMAALLALALAGAERLSLVADIAAAMTIEAHLASHMPFHPSVERLRPHEGLRLVSANMRRLLEESEIVLSHIDCDRVQDPYSMRAIPQVHGASRQALMHVRGIVETELNAVTDNPLVVTEELTAAELDYGAHGAGTAAHGKDGAFGEEHARGVVVSAGNFHGQPLALAADYATIAVAELANISERRTEQLVNPALSGLPAFLCEDGGLNSGLMVAQYTAAALVSENKVLAHPASVDSITTSANQEDHVSMGAHAARKLLQVVANAEYVVAVELMAAAQALDMRAPLKAGVGAAAAHEHVRSVVPHLGPDRYLKPDLESVRDEVRSGRLLAAVRAAGVEVS